MEILYSSTCPCSAALARQLIQVSFEEAFQPTDSLSFDDVRAWLGTQEGIVATPRSQRSVADVRVKLDPAESTFRFVELIDALEGALDRDDRYTDYRVRIDHQESLHAHDAVAIAVKEVDGGFTREAY